LHPAVDRFKIEVASKLDLKKHFELELGTI